MSESKNTSTEYENNKSGMDSSTYNRRKVNGIKRLILIVFLIMCAIPILFCLYLMAKMNNMENKLDELSIKLGARQHNIEKSAELEDNSVGIPVLDQDADSTLEKDAGFGNPSLSLTDTNKQDEDFELSKSYNSDSEVVSNGRKVYLTFDDGPSIYTGEILDILNANDVKATFFVVYSDNKDVWPYYNRIVDEGHTLAMHSYSHVYNKIYASEESFDEDVSLIHDFLLEQTGVDCKYYRFPGGSSNSVSCVDIRELMGYLYSRGITYFDWNALSGDAVNVALSSSELNDTVMGYVRNNTEDSIVLLHDLENNHATVEGLQELIDTLKSEGYEICPIDERTTPVQHVKFSAEN